VAIVSVESSRFPATDAYADLRTFAITLRRDAATLDNVPVQVEMAFFDRDPDTGRVMASRSLRPRQTLIVEGPWTAGEQKSVTATYAVAAAGRPGEAGRRPEFHGYVIRVYEAERLLAQAAKPAGLLGAAATNAPAGGGKGLVP
jgi:hypothetical protein